MLDAGKILVNCLAALTLALSTCARAHDIPTDVLVNAYVKPEGSAPAVKILHHTAICLARKRIWIQNPYFIPEPEAIDAFGRAVKRGVDVRVLMPSTSGSDCWSGSR